MANFDALKSMREEAVCPICLEFFAEPVTIDCGHNFCRVCIEQHWWSERGAATCPQCRTRLPRNSARPNCFVANMVENVRKLSLDERQPELRCPAHDERLKVFCSDDMAPICVVCATSRDHRGHFTSPVAEAAELYKGMVRNELKFFNEQMQEICQSQDKEEADIKKLKKVAANLQNDITSKFNQLHQFLRQEEESLRAKLEQEEKIILQQKEENMKIISEQRASFKQAISDLQGKLALDDAEFLQPFRVNHYNFRYSRSHEMWTHQEMDLYRFLDFLDFWAVLLKFKLKEKKRINDQDVKSILGRGSNLQFHKPTEVPIDLSHGDFNVLFQYNVWKRMLKLIKPVPAALTLNLNTAHERLVLSSDLRAVKLGEKQNVPDQAERFIHWHAVLALQGFRTGQHYWEVDVGKNTYWGMGVVKESLPRKSEFKPEPKSGFWVLWCLEEKYTIISSYRTSIPVRIKPQRLGIYLDYEAGKVSFYNTDDISHLHTFRDKFTEKLYPFFLTGCNIDSLQIVHLHI
ncbi:E3 ubiquitin-protein ligase TRIM39-like isoform X1 [Narcine bancroftii]|uniref:E3 ubiquitin-protein ligase TRIM39-like isoform X1 n=1 Tax=Narcine bancroftii TaxID=1343680 RepID=UPI00383220FF